MLRDEQNIILIGMPGVGKSTVGVLLAKATRRGFIDTDVYLQAGEGKALQEILDGHGIEAFRRMEEDYLLCLGAASHVVATGGSAVYSDKAMQSLKATGPVVHLELPLELLERRIDNMATRGIVMARGQTLADVFARRAPLYCRWADLTVQCVQKTQDQIVSEIVRRIC
jgi:shikimate kinase